MSFHRLLRSITKRPLLTYRAGRKFFKRFLKAIKFAATLGRRGERAAARHLAHLGYVILERNWRRTAGEVDIIAAKDRTLVFFEVKTRRSDTAIHFNAAAAVDQNKEKRIFTAADEYIFHERLLIRRAKLRRTKFAVVEVIFPASRLIGYFWRARVGVVFRDFN